MNIEKSTKYSITDKKFLLLQFEIKHILNKEEFKSDLKSVIPIVGVIWAIKTQKPAKELLESLPIIYNKMLTQHPELKAYTKSNWSNAQLINPSSFKSKAVLMFNES